MKILLLTGPQRVGKTTFGKALAAKSKLPHASFGDGVKLVASRFVPSLKDEFYLEDKPQYVRDILHKVSKLYREIVQDDDVFTKLALSRAIDGKIIISDLRYLRELVYLSRYNPMIVWIGGESDKYDLAEIRKHVNIFVPKYPSVDKFLAGEYVATRNTR